jgi:hypothetical protein
MSFGRFAFFPANHSSSQLPALICLVALIAVVGVFSAWGDSVPTPSKKIIGATAKLTEVSTGFTFAARVDTGAKSCSLHVEKVTIENEESNRVRNVGKKIRFLVLDGSGKKEGVETRIAKAVRIKSSVFDNGQYDHRYKVPLTFEWNGFRKEVLVTLNDRTNMEYPLLIGRNFLHGDFLVDVAKNDGK